MGIAARKTKGWHSADIVAAVRKKGSSLVEISENLGLARASGSRALIHPHRRVNEAIAELIGVPLHILWPLWFDADGARIPMRAPARRDPLTTRVHESNPRVRASSKAA